MKLNETTKKVTGKVKETWSKIPGFWKGYGLAAGVCIGSIVVESKLRKRKVFKAWKEGYRLAGKMLENGCFELEFTPVSKVLKKMSFVLPEDLAIKLMDGLLDAYPD